MLNFLRNEGFTTRCKGADFERAVEILNDDDDNEAGPAITKLLNEDPGLINQQDEKGWTLLHHAVRNYEYSVDGETILDFVFEMHYPGYRQLARYLKGKGARSGKSKG